MAQTPLQSRTPLRLALRLPSLAQGGQGGAADDERRDGGQMIRTGEHVNETGGEAGEGGKDHRWIAFNWKNSSSASGPISRPIPDFL